MSKKEEKGKEEKGKELLIPTEYSDRFYAIMDKIWEYNDEQWRQAWTEIIAFLENLTK
jgi:hypothetical protein